MGTHRPFGDLWAQVEKKLQHDRAPQATRLSLSIPCPVKGLLFSIKLQEMGMVCTHQRHSTLCLPQLLNHVRNWQTSAANQNQLKNADFSLLLHFKTSRRKENQQTSQVCFGSVLLPGHQSVVHFTQQFVHHLFLSKALWLQQPLFQGPCYCVRGGGMWSKVQGEPHEPGPWGCCCCSSLWQVLPPLEINDTLGLTWGLAAKTNNSNKHPGWACPYRGVAAKYFWIQACSTPGHPVPVSCVDGPCVLLISVFPAPLSQPQSHPQHVCPVASASAATMGNLDVWCAQGCITEQWDTLMGFWLAVKLQGGYFLPGQTESAPLEMMWQCRGCREGITRSSCSQCWCDRKGTWSWYSAWGNFSILASPH